MKANAKFGAKLAVALCAVAVLSASAVSAETYAISDSSGGVVSNTVETLQSGKLRVTSLYIFTNTAETASITFSEAATVDVLVVGGGGAGTRNCGGGGGGGGGRASTPYGDPAAGGSGIVIVRYVATVAAGDDLVVDYGGFMVKYH